MKATLNFDLSNEDDRSNYKSAMNGRSLEALLFDLANDFLRKKIKYAPEDQHEEYTRALEEVRKYIFDYIADSKIDMEI